MHGRIQESNGRMGRDKIKGQSRSFMCVDKSSSTFNQSVINCTHLCSCRYFYHMISSSHMSALPKFDFSCDFSGGYPYFRQHFTLTLISVQPGNGLLAHEPFANQQPDWTFSDRNSRPFLPHRKHSSSCSFEVLQD